jgi:hypothetical protein
MSRKNRMRLKENDQLALRNQEPMKPSGAKVTQIGGPTPTDDNAKLDADADVVKDTSASSKASVAAAPRPSINEDDDDLDALDLDIEFGDEDDLSDLEEDDDEDKDKEPVNEDDDKEDDKAVNEDDEDEDEDKAVNEDDDKEDEDALKEDDDNPFKDKDGDDKEDDKAVNEDDDKEDDLNEDDEEEKKEKVEESAKIRLSLRGDLSKLMASETTLSESFKKDASKLFEAVVKSKIRTVSEALNKHYSRRAKQNAARLEEKMISRVDRYLNHITEEWLKENKVAVTSGLRADLTADFIAGLKTLFKEHYIDIPEDKVSVVEALSVKVQKLEESLNKAQHVNMELKESLKNGTKASIIAEAVENLPLSSQEQVKTIANDLDFTSAKEFRAQVSKLVESIGTPKVAKKMTGGAPAEATVLAEDADKRKKTKNNNGDIDPDVAAVASVL